MNIHELMNSVDVNTMTINNLNKDEESKAEKGQFFTPIKIACFMSSLFSPISKDFIRILDPGAGTGNLTAALIETILKREITPKKIEVVLYENDEGLYSSLDASMKLCKGLCDGKNIQFKYIIECKDFLLEATNSKDSISFDYIIINPPYKKLGTNTDHKRALLEVDINVPNYYAAFVSLAMRMLRAKESQLVCIVPRSFCNGSYFKSFRHDLTTTKKIDHIHIFESRKDLFYDDVLQETVILKLSNKIQKDNDKVSISTTTLNDFEKLKNFEQRFDNIVFPNDNLKIIRIINEDQNKIVAQMNSLQNDLTDIKLGVSTGPIVDFREEKDSLLDSPTIFTLPLIYPEHIRHGYVDVYKKTKKAGYILPSDKNVKRLRPNGCYVLVKRMSSKEEQKRISAAVYDGNKLPYKYAAFDNKTNYFHSDFKGLESKELAKGLSLYLNSSFVDFFFRTYSGSTQVNVSDLKGLKFPSLEKLILIGSMYDEFLPEQDKIDSIIETFILGQEVI
ncbi:hypothetical protein EH196_19345 [Bacillus sp. C1-1]|nr:hypothetical protein EH196_19345 [Bacillus sp. C1-1]